MGVASPGADTSAFCIPKSISLMRRDHSRAGPPSASRKLDAIAAWVVILWKILASRSPMSRPSFTDDEALAFHAGEKPGKLEVVPTKPMATQRDLSLAYSPGVAVPGLRVAENPDLAYDYTAKGNMGAGSSKGTPIPGVGGLGALASQPVNGGKAGLFKRFPHLKAK